eukprot:s3523_g10.t1
MALHQLGDLEMELDSEGVATAIYVPPNVRVINPHNVLPPIEALEEMRIDQLNEWLDSHDPDHPYYAEAYKERWCEFRPGHPLSNGVDEENFKDGVGIFWLVSDQNCNRYQSHCPHHHPVQHQPQMLCLFQHHLMAVMYALTRTSPRKEPISIWTLRLARIVEKFSSELPRIRSCPLDQMLLRPHNRPNAVTLVLVGRVPMATVANTCMVCGKVATGHYTHTRSGMPMSSTSMPQTSIGEARPLGNFTIDQVQEIFRTCLVVARVKADEDGCQKMSSASMHRILDAVSATMALNAPTSMPSATDPSMDEKDNKAIFFGEFRGRTFLDVFENEKPWCMGQSETKNRKLKEFVNYLQRKTNPRLGFMAMSGGGSEKDLIAILDSGCNKTCHGEKWLTRYMETVDQHHYPLEPDHGGGFRGIGRAINTKGTRNLDVCVEIVDGMAIGEIDSIELEDSDAPLLLSIADQRKLG